MLRIAFGHRGSDRDEPGASRRRSHVGRRDNHPGLRDWGRRDGNVQNYGQRKQHPDDGSVRRLRDRDERSMDSREHGDDRPDGWTGGNGAGNQSACLSCDLCRFVSYDGACLLAGLYRSRMPAWDLWPQGDDGALVDDRRPHRLPRSRNRRRHPGPAFDRRAANSLLPSHLLRQSGSFQDGDEKPGADAGDGMAESTAVLAVPGSPSAWLRPSRVGEGELES